MTPLWLSRARLRRDAPINALVDVILPGDAAARTYAGHRLVWTLFADHADRRRDFLWREADPGLFYLLSARPPADHHNLFRLDPPKEFTPALAIGDRLGFSLRANATVARGGGPGKRGKPCDVVMDALHRANRGERAAVRSELAYGRADPDSGAEVVRPAGLAWLERQAAKNGFSVDPGEGGRVAVTRYETLHFARPGERMTIGVLDFEGVLVVRDGAALLAGIANGFGRAKGFGCGLMLVRRV